MMRFIRYFLYLLIIAAIAWPFTAIYRLGNALASNDIQMMDKLIDIEKVRERYKVIVDQQASNIKGLKSLAPQNTELSTLTQFVGDSLQGINNLAVGQVVTIGWIREQMRPETANDDNHYPSLLFNTSFAFYESPNRFLVRMGELGESPLHYYLQLDTELWEWRVTAIYP